MSTPSDCAAFHSTFWSLFLVRQVSGSAPASVPALGGVITVVGSITAISPPSVPVPVAGSITGSVVGFVVGSVVGAVVVVCPVCGPDVMSVPVWGLTEGCGSGSVRSPELPSTTGEGSGVGLVPPTCDVASPVPVSCPFSAVSCVAIVLAGVVKIGSPAPPPPPPHAAINGINAIVHSVDV